MKLRYCFAVVLCLTAALYVTAVFSDGLQRFDASKLTGEKDAAISHYHAIDLHPMAEVALPVSNAPTEVAAPVEPTPVDDVTPAANVDQPPPERNSTPPAAQWTVADAQRVLSFQFSADVSTADLQRLLDERGAAVLALKLNADRVLDAVVTEENGRVLRYYRRDDERAFEQFRTAFPSDRCFYVWWPNASNPVSEIAEPSLAQFGLRADDYQVYLIVAEPISGQLQRELDRAARQRGIAPDEITAAQATFQKTPDGLRPVVESVQAAKGVIGR